WSTGPFRSLREPLQTPPAPPSLGSSGGTATRDISLFTIKEVPHDQRTHGGNRRPESQSPQQRTNRRPSFTPNVDCLSHRLPGGDIGLRLHLLGKRQCRLGGRCHLAG